MAMGFDDARHLVSRTGLGTPPREVARLAKLGRKKAIETLLSEARTDTVSKLPPWAGEPVKPREVLMAAMTDAKEVQELLRSRGVELKQWWFREMTGTSSPLTERMVLFWHNHFTSSLRKVKRPELLARQNQTFRSKAFGRFDVLLRAVLHDPAMLVYLDNVRNHATSPNENLGRELLELFTLGEGNYTEQDVKAAARALTGWTVNRRNGEFRNAIWKHDGGEKALLGKRGKFDGDDLVDVILQHPACARWIAGKLRAEFITTPASAGEVERLATVLRDGQWSIATLVRTILESDAFWAPQNRGTRIKSPVELLVGTVRTLELRVPDDRVFVQAGRGLGQDLFDPPNVKGWPGGDAWITSNALLRRVTLMARAGQLETEIQDLSSWFAGVFASLDTAERMQRVLLAVPPVHQIPTHDVRQQVQALLTDPTYQLG